MANAQEILADARVPEYPQDIVIGELNTSNQLLDDRAALQAAWERDGYWYFKDVLDRAVVGKLRAIWLEYLQRQGLIDSDVHENRYNHSGFADKNLQPADLERVLEFNERNVHKVLTDDPEINGTMRQILGDDPFWLPQTEYRANPPGGDPAKGRLIYPHQDGFYSRGLDMKICWIPVDRVDRETGGCAWVEGAHQGRSCTTPIIRRHFPSVRSRYLATAGRPQRSSRATSSCFTSIRRTAG